jgi:anti-sigma-K factor RskA
LDVKDYIASGILETYVLGHCTPAEAREVERMIHEHQEIQGEVELIRNSLNAYGSAFDRQPPENLKEQIWQAIEADAIASESPVIPINRRDGQKRIASWAVAASFTLFILAGAMNVYLYSKWKSAEKQIAAIRSEKEYFANQFKVGQANLMAIRIELDFIQHPETRKVFMKGTEVHPQALATVFWNVKSREVYLKANSLPVVPSGKQYQLWAIVDGAPVNAGMIDSNEVQFQRMELFEKAQAFAITLEPSGGSTAPTLEDLFVIGNI